MEKLYKAIIGAGIGWVLLGPIGAIIGGMIATQITNKTAIDMGSHPYNQTRKGDFFVSLIVIFAYVVKADTKIRKSEIFYVKRHLLENITDKKLVQDLMNMLKVLLEKDIEIKEVTEQIADNMNYSSRLQLIHFLFELALIDGELHILEDKAIRRITVLLEISMQDYESIYSIYHQENENSEYKILKISPNASIHEIKVAYKEMASKYHPDKVSYLGEDMIKLAEDKFKAINNAYSSIRKSRNF